MTSHSRVTSDSELLHWSVENVTDWLAGLRLERDYSTLFREYRIDGNALFKMTTSFIDQHLQISNRVDRDALVHSISVLRMNKLCTHLPRFREPSAATPPNIDTSLEMMSRHKLLRDYKSKSVDEATLPTEGGPPPKSLTPTPPFSSYLLDILKEENSQLKNELEYYYQRVCKLQQLEQELEHLSEAHRLLEGTTTRKDKLELTMRTKLEAELRHYKEADTQREVNLHSIRRNVSFKAAKPEIVMKKELARRDSVIAKLVKQNQDVTTVREKLEKDLHTMRSALSATERRGSREEGDEQKDEDKPANDNQAASKYSDNINKLQSILSAMLTSSQKQQKLEYQLRTQLEQRVRELEGREKTADIKVGDLRMATLEADKAKLEHKCLELVAERQLIQDVVSIPRDTYINQLERQLQEKENELVMTREQKYFYMKRLESSEGSLTTLNTRVPSLEATLKEKETLIETLKSLLDPDDNPDVTSGDQQLFTAGCKQSLPNMTNCYKPTLPIRKMSSPLIPIYHSQEKRNGTIDCTSQYNPVTLTPPSPSLPTYDQHMNNGCSLMGLTAPNNFHLKIVSRSSPNTPDVQRRVNYGGYHPTVSAPNSHQGSPLPVHRDKLCPVYKSLTPPPHQLPPQYSCGGPQCQTSGMSSTQRVMRTYRSNTDAKSLDSDDSLDSLLSPSSPPSTNWLHTHRYSNSFPNSARRQCAIQESVGQFGEGRSQDSGVLVEAVFPSHF